jgi:hypothetical protein
MWLRRHAEEIAAAAGIFGIGELPEQMLGAYLSAAES